MVAKAKSLRNIAVYLWSLGFALAAADRFSFTLSQWQISYSYVFFTFAFLICLLAEKREFSTRVALYRLHDVAIYGPWRFLLLYFLWTSIFSPFTQDPIKSVVYSAGGWFSLLAVGFSAELIFCERSLRGSVFVPERLRIAFFLYAIAMIVLFAVSGLHLFYRSSLPVLNQDPANLFLYFALGLPFLLWDFLKIHRRMLPRPLSALAIVLGIVTPLSLGRNFFSLSLALLLGAFGALSAYKKIRIRPLFLSLFFLLLACAIGFVALRNFSVFVPRPVVIAEMHFSTAWKLLKESRGLGVGLGISSYNGIWRRVLVEAGGIGFLLYAAYFLDLLYGLYKIRREARVVVSNVAFVSAAYFVILGSHYLLNPYGAYIWAWYAIWTVFSAYYRKKDARDFAV